MAGIVDGGKVVALPSARDDQAEAVISGLELALQFARESPCHSMCVFLMGRDNQNTLVEEFESRTALLGALTRLQFQIMSDE